MKFMFLTSLNDSISLWQSFFHTARRSRVYRGGGGGGGRGVHLKLLFGMVVDDHFCPLRPNCKHQQVQMNMPGRYLHLISYELPGDLHTFA